MPSNSSRRAFLRGSALAMVSATAGCSFGTDESSGSGPRPGRSPGEGSGDGSGQGSGSNGTLPGSNGGRTFGLAVTNTITNEDLSDTEIAKGTPAVLDIEVARVVRAEDDPVIFEDTVEVSPGGSKTVENAFTTETGKSYQVSAHLHKLRDFEGTPQWLTERFQWEEGGFGAPEETVIDVKVIDLEDGSFLLPGVNVG